MSQQVAFSSFDPSVLIYKYREKFAYGEPEEGCKFLGNWEAEIYREEARITIGIFRVCDLPQDTQKKVQECFQAVMKIPNGASRYHVTSSSVFSTTHLSLDNTEKSRSYSKKNGHRFRTVLSLKYRIKRSQSREEKLSREAKSFIAYIQSMIKNHFPNAEEKEKKEPIPRNGFAAAATEIV